MIVVRSVDFIPSFCIALSPSLALLIKFRDLLGHCDNHHALCGFHMFYTSCLRYIILRSHNVRSDHCSIVAEVAIGLSVIGLVTVLHNFVL